MRRWRSSRCSWNAGGFTVEIDFFWWKLGGGAKSPPPPPSPPIRQDDRWDPTQTPGTTPLSSISIVNSTYFCYCLVANLTCLRTNSSLFLSIRNQLDIIVFHQYKCVHPAGKKKCGSSWWVSSMQLRTPIQS
jgi:hypothetical protein